MRSYLMFFLFYFSISLTYKEEELVSIEYLIEKKINFDSNKIYLFIMEIEKNLELNNLYIKVLFYKSNRNISLGLYGLICEDLNFTLSHCDGFNISDSDKMNFMTREGDELFQYPINFLTNKDKYRYLLFVMEIDSQKNKYYDASIFVFPLKIFDLSYSTILNITKYYQNKIILKNSFFYLRIKEKNLLDATLKLTTELENSSLFNVYGLEYSLYPDDKRIQNTIEYDREFFCGYNSTENEYYIYNYDLYCNNTYLVLIVYLKEKLEYLNVSLTRNYPEASDNPEESQIPKKTEDPEDSSTSPALIAFIVIICIIFVAFIVYFILRKLGYFRKNLLTSDEIESNKKPSINQNIVTQGNENNNSAPPTPILERSYIKEKD